MKWNIITHNIRGLDDPESIAKERGFISMLTPKVDVIMIQEHKLRGRALENLGSRLMPECASRVLEAAPGERSWLNPNAAGKGGVGILLANKYAKLVTATGALYENRVVWIKLEGVEGGNIGLACIYAPNILTDRRHLWHLLVDALPKDCEWIIGGDFNMTERPEDKSHGCGRTISDLESYTWKEFSNSIQVRDEFLHQGGPRFSWDNGQKGERRRLARLDRFYTPSQSRLNTRITTYFIHGYAVGSDHAPVHIEVYMGSGEDQKGAFKWNTSHLKGELREKLEERWVSLLEGTNFFYKLRNISRFYRQACKQKAKDNRRIELDTKAKLEVAMAKLYEDVNSFEKQCEVNRLKNTIDSIETRKAIGAAIRSRVKWQ